MSQPLNVSGQWQSEIKFLRARLQEVVADTEDARLQPLMKALKPLNLPPSESASSGVVMMRVKDSCGTVFHLGEVLVTEARIRLSEIDGYGCCLGKRTEGAVALACLDALSRQSSPFPLEDIRAAIDEIYRQVLQQRQEHGRMVAATRVDFRSMAEE